MQVIKTITKTPIKIKTGGEKTNMCQAVDEMIEDGRNEGRNEGRKKGSNCENSDWSDKRWNLINRGSSEQSGDVSGRIKNKY